jgi:hypothetical protein
MEWWGQRWVAIKGLHFVSEFTWDGSQLHGFIDTWLYMIVLFESFLLTLALWVPGPIPTRFSE